MAKYNGHQHASELFSEVPRKISRADFEFLQKRRAQQALCADRKQRLEQEKPVKPCP